MNAFSLSNILGKLADNLTVQNAVLSGIAVLLLINLKGITGVWHIRLFKGLAEQWLFAKSGRDLESIQGTSVPRLFAYLVTSHRNSPIECDYNIHKSNSTFFSDLDINRSQLLISLFGGLPRWSSTPDGKESALRVALGGTSCVFKREIKPFQQYEVWSRVLTWDEKWIYIISYFVKKGAGDMVTKALEKPGQDTQEAAFDSQKAILASSITRYVFKQGRITVQPESLFMKAGLYPRPDSADSQDDISFDAPEKEDHWDFEMYEKQKERGLEIATSFHGLDSAASHFGEMSSSILRRSTDL